MLESSGIPYSSPFQNTVAIVLPIYLSEGLEVCVDLPTVGLPSSERQQQSYGRIGLVWFVTGQLGLRLQRMPRAFTSPNLYGAGRLKPDTRRSLS